MGAEFVCSSQPPVELGDYNQWDVVFAGGAVGTVDERSDLGRENYAVTVSILGVQVCYGLPNEGNDRDITGLAETGLLSLAGVI